MSKLLVMSLSVGASIGYLLPEEATRWEAIKAAAAAGFAVAMGLVWWELQHAQPEAAADGAGEEAAGADTGAGGAAGSQSRSCQTDPVPGLSPLPLPIAAGTWRAVAPPDNPAPDGDAVE